jgi:hypothetical protein
LFSDSERIGDAVAALAVADPVRNPTSHGPPDDANAVGELVDSAAGELESSTGLVVPQLRLPLKNLRVCRANFQDVQRCPGMSKDVFGDVPRWARDVPPVCAS